MNVTGKVRVRFYLNGELVDEAWMYDEGKVQIISLDHLNRAKRAEAAGQVWMLEFYDPYMFGDHAYLRMGTDEQAMINPFAGDLTHAAEVIDRWVKG